MLSKMFYLTMSAILAFGAVACGGDDDETTPEGNDTGKTSDPGGDGDTDSDTANTTDDGTDETDIPTDDSDTTPKLGMSVFPAEGSGWVGQDENDLKMQGAWYTFGCDSAVVEPESEITRTADGICFSGTSAAVVDGNGDGELDWDTMWGAGVGFDICAYGADEEDTELAETRSPMGSCPFNPTMADNIVGIQVDLTGEVNAKDNLRIMFNEGDNVANAYVITDQINSTVTALFKDAQVWYKPSLKLEGVLKNNILAFQFQIPANDTAEVSWNMCITDLRVLTEADLPAEDTATE